MSVTASAPIVWRPNRGPQTAFLSDASDWVLYGGAAGGGKSDALLIDATGQIEDGAYQAILFRRNYPALEELIKRSHELYPLMGGQWHKTEKTWRFPSGATIKFRFLERDEDVRNYQGHQYQWIGFDELTHFTEWQWWYMFSRCRPRRVGQRCYMRASCNPDGPGLHWVKAMFVDCAPAGQLVRREIANPITGKTEHITQRFIPAKLKDNPALANSSYAITLASLPDAERKALLEGDWDAYTGSVFKLERGTHVWTWDQFKERTGHDGIPNHWPRFRVMDWGYSHPFAIVWIATDEDGRGYVYREWYGVAKSDNGTVKADVGVSLQPSLVGERIAHTETEAKERIGGAWTGPDLNSAGTGDTSAGIKRIEYFNQAGVWFDFWTAGPDSRKAKKTALHERLAYTLAPDGTVKEWPGLIFLDGAAVPLPKGWGEMTNGAKHCIRTIPALEYDATKGGEDVDSKMEDHAYDAVSAWCLMRPWQARKPKSELEQALAARRKGKGTWMSR